MDFGRFTQTAGRRRSSLGQVLDLDHLARQTMGDEQVQREVLALFVEQARSCVEGFVETDEAARKAVAHRLLGAARGIGAVGVADAAQALEGNPLSEACVAAVRAAVEEAETLLRELCA